jgi:hypothetical protein
MECVDVGEEVDQRETKRRKDETLCDPLLPKMSFVLARAQPRLLFHVLMKWRFVHHTPSTVRFNHWTAMKVRYRFCIVQGENKSMVKVMRCKQNVMLAPE